MAEMTVGLSNGLKSDLSQTQTLSPQMREGLRLLHMGALELSAEIRQQIDANPVLENVEDATPVLSDVEHREKLADDVRTEELPEDEAAPSYSANEDAVERRERLFERQTVTETLQDHLLAQVPLSDIPARDRELAETLIGGIDDDGRFRGSTADIQMVTGADERRINAVLRRILRFDPTGCGGRTVPETLAAQLDKLDDDPWQDEVRKIVARHWDDLVAGRRETVRNALGLNEADFASALAALRKLTPWPGRAFAPAPSDRDYVRPEIRAVLRDGRWTAEVDARDLPPIRLSPRYVKMLDDPAVTPETKDYVREKIRAAEAFRETLVRRQETIRSIAQAIFDAQPDFFEKGLAGLRPLTMRTIAEKTGVHEATVSRTAHAKAVATPHGTVVLKRFFVQGFAEAGGGSVSRDGVEERIRALVAAEDPAAPLSDEKLVSALAAEGLTVARRTVAKYRTRLGIPGTSERRKAGAAHV